jgi:hypothetical protein
MGLMSQGVKGLSFIESLFHQLLAPLQIIQIRTKKKDSNQKISPQIIAMHRHFDGVALANNIAVS